MHPISYDRHRFPPEVIRHAIWLYARLGRLHEAEGRQVTAGREGGRGVEEGRPKDGKPKGKPVATKQDAGGRQTVQANEE